MAQFVLDSLKLGRMSMIRENTKIAEQVDALIQDIETRGIVAITEKSAEIKVVFIKLCICTTPDVAEILGKAAKAVNGETQIELIEVYRVDSSKYLLRDADGNWYMCHRHTWTPIDGQILERRRGHMYRYSTRAKYHQKMVKEWRESGVIGQAPLSIAQ